MKKTLLTLLICFFGVSAMGQNLDTIPYFRTDSMPNAGIYLPAPPDTCSQLFIDDFQQWLWGKSMRHTPRGQQASWESLYSVDRMCGIYSEALGFVVSREATPAIYRLISRGQKAAAQAVDPAKAKYMRKRPFARMNEHVAGAFDDEEELRTNGSYPSGHTIRGWTAALVLSEVNPDSANALLARGYEFGQSRVIAGYHWQSDVDAARLVASAAVARMHADERFLELLEKAKNEMRKDEK